MARDLSICLHGTGIKKVVSVLTHVQLTDIVFIKVH